MPNDVRKQVKSESGLPAAAKKPAVSGEAPSPRRHDWRGANLRGASMAGLNLEHADLRAADLRDVNFSGSNLRYADLRGANIRGANFQQASLYGARMQGVEAFGTDFRNCDLRQANFGGAYLEGAIMPPPERLPSPGEILGGQGPQEKGWRQREQERKDNANQDRSAGNDQNRQARGRGR
jgi:hypothetical protein